MTVRMLRWGGDCKTMFWLGLLSSLPLPLLFKAVLIRMNKIPFKLEPDVSDELRGRLNWAKRNYEYHKRKAEAK